MNNKFGIRIKRKVRERIGFTDLTPILIEIFNSLIFIANEFKRNIIITSINDLKHRIDSEHYHNNALDIRVWGMPKDMRKFIVNYFNKVHPELIAIDEGDHIHIGRRRKAL